MIDVPNEFESDEKNSMVFARYKSDAKFLILTPH